MKLQSLVFNFIGFLAVVLTACSAGGNARVSLLPADSSPCQAKLHADVVEKVPSESLQIRNLHWLGKLNGFSNIYRSASPILELAVPASASPSEPQIFDKAKSRLESLYQLGIRTIVSLEFYRTSEGSLRLGDPTDITRVTPEQRSILIEKAAAESVGIRFLLLPLLNDGENSLRTMSDAEVLKFLEQASHEIFTAAVRGGVDFHCSVGHDRTGLVAAYLRMKYQGWSYEAADEEMRKMGHDWPLFAPGCKLTSWQEDHLHNIFKQMNCR